MIKKAKAKYIITFLCSGLFVCCGEVSAALAAKPATEEGYTINFDNVSIKEFLKFISRIGNVNVIYNDADLNFNVTIVSEDKTDLENIMSALVQVLRIHGLTLIEEEKNLIIHGNTDVRQIPTVVSDEVPLTGKVKPAIMTKVFKISKGNPAHIASLITPMLSRDALVEVSMGTMQLIITDVASSIDTVAELLMSLDAPQTPYDVEVYASKNISVLELATLAKKILDPIIDNTVLELVPQIDTGTLYIVSTPFLIEKTLTVLKELDKETIVVAEPKNLTAENVFIYKLQHKNAEEVLANLKKIAEEANLQGFSSAGLGSTIASAKFIKSTRSLMFIGPPATLTIIESLLKSVDATTMTTLEIENSSFYFFEPQGISVEDTIKVLKEISSNLKKNEYSRPGLIHTIDSAKPILPLETILFTGSPATLAELKPLLASVQDSVLSVEKVEGPYKFFIYNIKEANEEQMRSSLHNLADYLDSNRYPNVELIKAIRTMKWIKATNSLMFTGHQAALKELTDIIPSFDVPKQRSQAPPTQTPLSTDFVLFSPKNVSIEGFKAAIEEMAKNLKSADLADPAFLKTLETVKELPSSEQLIFTGDESSLKRLSAVLTEIDQQESTLKEGPYLVQVGQTEYQKVKNALDLLISGLPKADPLTEMVKGMKYLPEANVIVFRGSNAAMQKITQIIELTTSAEKERRLGLNVVFVPVQETDAKVIIKMLQETGSRLESSKSASPEFIATLKGATANGNLITLSGSPEDISKAKELIETEEKTLAAQRNIPSTDTAFVPLQQADAKVVIKMLQQTADRLSKIEGSSPGLVATLKGAEASGNTIILSGTAENIAQAKELINREEAVAASGKNIAPADTVFVPLEQADPKAVLKMLQETGDRLAKIEGSSPGLIATLKGAQANGNTIILSGTAENIAQAKELIHREEAIGAPANTSFVPLEQADPKVVIKMLQEAGDRLAKIEGSSPSLVATLKGAQTSGNTIILSGTAENIAQAKELIYQEEAILASGKNVTPTNTSFVPLEQADPKVVIKMLQEAGDRLAKIEGSSSSLVATLKGAQASGNTIILSGTAENIAQAKELIHREEAILASGKNVAPANTAFVSLQEADPKVVLKMLQETGDRLAKIEGSSPSLVATLKGAQASGNTIILSGTAENIAQAKELINREEAILASEKTVTPMSTAFVPLQQSDAKTIVQMMRETADRLEKIEGSSPGLITTLRGAQAKGNLVILSGTPESITQAKELINTEESLLASGRVSPSSSTAFIPVQQADPSAVVKMLKETADRLEKMEGTSPGLIATLKGAEASGNSVILSGSSESIAQAKELIETQEKLLASEKNAPPSNTAFVPIQKAEGASVVKMLHETAKRLEKIEGASSDLVATLRGAQLTANENMVILSGKPESIAKAQELINIDLATLPPGTNTEVWLYRPKYLSAKELNASLIGVARHADEQNPSKSTKALVTCIESMREIPDSKTVQFVGSEKTLQKLKELIDILDVQTGSNIKATELGNNFLVYKVKYINPQDLLNHLKQLTKDESLSGQDTSLAKTVKNARYVKESHSLIFTGNKGDLEKIETFLNDLDVSQSPPQVATDRRIEGYKLYRPVYVSGVELIQMVKNFEEHLVASGGSNEALSEVIDHLSYISRTNAIIVTGDDKSVEEVMHLFKEFDTADAASGDGGPYNDENIETIDDTGFLIYKLQHQTGEGIVGALSLISSDLTNMKTQKKNESLIESIRSVQWIEMTNSLIATGEPKVLTKLKELIESIDRPLKQVFIEILVIEVSDTTSVDIGLRWGSFGANENRIGWGLGNYPATDTGQSTAAFTQNFPTITGTNVPSGGADIPPVNSGFLGVIGDLIWANGKSYASLGSLITALKADGDTTVVLSQKIVTQDNQNAKIFSGDNVPFTGSLVTTSGLSQTTNANLEYRNIGVTLSITPIIGDNGLITMDIDQEISEDANQGQNASSAVSTNSVNGITTTRTSMKTRVHMPDRHFLVLSGTMRNQVIRSVSGIPCLGGLPMIGAAFSDTQKLTVNRNVIIFVKPHIINSLEVYESITRNQQEIYGNAKQANVKDFQSALELIRSPDDEEYDDEED